MILQYIIANGVTVPKVKAYKVFPTFLLEAAFVSKSMAEGGGTDKESQSVIFDDTTVSTSVWSFNSDGSNADEG